MREFKMESKDKAIDYIVSRILTLDPYRIVLFGSRVSGMEDSESDIDLLVVLDSGSIAPTYEERMKRRLMVRDRIREINKRLPIDLIVYTKAEYEFLQKYGVSFLNEIEKSGKTVYEKTG